MQLEEIKIKNFRSIWDKNKRNKHLILQLSNGLNQIVGPNNCGKSNIFDAIRMAISADHAKEYDQDKDVPVAKKTSSPQVLLSFKLQYKTGREKTLKNKVNRYERSLGKRKTEKTYAEDRLINFAVEFPYTKKGNAQANRYFRARGAGARKGAATKELTEALEKLNFNLKFVSLSSGQDVSSLLNSTFIHVLEDILEDRLKKEYKEAEQSRKQYLESLQKKLFEPISNHLSKELEHIFPEVENAEIEPNILSITDIFPKSKFIIEDTAKTILSRKGTGVRGGVLISLLNYISKKTRGSCVFLLEEPESFLHPEAQKKVLKNLEELCQRNKVTILMTTHSPSMISQDSDSKIFYLEKTTEGNTFLSYESMGNEIDFREMKQFFGDLITPNLYQKANKLDRKKSLYLVVEGETDKEYIIEAARKLKKTSLLDKIQIFPSKGAKDLVIKAAQIKSDIQRSTAKKILVLLDYDKVGSQAQDVLTGYFKFKNKEQVVTYREWHPAGRSNKFIEAEDMFRQKFLEKFIDEEGEGKVLAEKKRFNPKGFHYGFTKKGKEIFPKYVQKNAGKNDFKYWGDLLDYLNDKAK